MLKNVTLLIVCISAQLQLCSQVYVNEDSYCFGIKSQIELKLQPNQYLIAYPIPKFFSDKVEIIVEVGEHTPELKGRKYVTMLIKDGDKKERVKRIVFKSEASVIDYFTTNGFEFKDGERNSFIFQQK